MDQLDLFNNAPPTGPQPGDVFRMTNHGEWKVTHRQSDGRIVLRGDHGFQVVTEDDLSTRFIRRQP